MFLNLLIISTAAALRPPKRVDEFPAANTASKNPSGCLRASAEGQIVPQPPFGPQTLPCCVYLFLAVLYHKEEVLSMDRLVNKGSRVHEFTVTVKKYHLMRGGVRGKKRI
jgi:hypothetical protein